ncbi:MAG: hypothetical protein AB1730_01590 [Myxococcota bacterium]|jgi:hypothetical protein
MASDIDRLLAPPWALPGEADARLLGYLRDEDWASAQTLLRDAVAAPEVKPVWLVLLAYARFRDATEVMVDELPGACRECLALLDRAGELGAPMDGVGPLRDAVERALDEVSREELRLTSQLGDNDDAARLSDDDLEACAFILSGAAPARAAGLFSQLAARASGPKAVVARARGALCLVQAGRRDEAQPLLEAAFAQDWTQPGLSAERLVLESVETALLESAEGDDFTALWRLAEERGQALRFPFPSAWPNQEKLLARCLALGDGPRARAVARRIEDGRHELSRALTDAISRARRARA